MGCCLQCFGYETTKYSPLDRFFQRSTTSNRNSQFFKNEIRSEPNGDFIDEIHSRWYHDYLKLESHHGYIQWLFPLPEEGVNSKAQRLTSEEIEFISNDPQAQGRLLTSYRMMANFYGMELVDSTTGELKRTDNWAQRMNNLNRMTHNNLRITRIINSMQLLGLGHLTSPFVHFLVREIFKEGTLPASRDSCQRFWIPSLSLNEQAEVNDYIRRLQEREHE